MQTDPDESADEVDGLMIRTHSTPERLFTACGEGEKDDVAAILRTWGTGFPGGRQLPAQALLEAIAWARVDVVRMLLDCGASVTARGKVSTPGGSGVVDEDTAWVNAAELCRMMVSAGLRPRRALAVAKLVEAKLNPPQSISSTSDNDDVDDTNTNNQSRRKCERVVKRPRRFEAGPSQRSQRPRLGPTSTPAIHNDDDDDDDGEPDEKPEGARHALRSGAAGASSRHCEHERRGRAAIQDGGSSVITRIPAPRLVTMPPAVKAQLPIHRLATAAGLVRVAREPSERMRACAEALTTLPTSCRSSGSSSPAMLIEAVAVCEGEDRDGDGDVDGVGGVGVGVDGRGGPIQHVECALVAAAGSSSGVAYEHSGSPRSRDDEIRHLEGSVRELRQMLNEQGKILAEQNALLTQLYQAGVAAATALQPCAPTVPLPPAMARSANARCGGA